jgi:hypothetical protein
VSSGNDIVTIEQVGIHKMQEAIEENGNRPIVGSEWGDFETLGETLITTGLLEMLLNGHSQETAASAAGDEDRGEEKNTTSAWGEGAREVMRNSKLTSGNCRSIAEYC